MRCIKHYSPNTKGQTTMFKTMNRADIMNLFNEVNNSPRTDEISIFKKKYNEMVASGKLKKGSFAVPYTDSSKYSDDIDEFVSEYVDSLSDESREAIINDYGIKNAIYLLCKWHRSGLKCPESEITEFFKESNIESIETHAITLILYDSIAVFMDWKYT